MPSERLEISFEFFPPRSEEGLSSLLRTASKLSIYRPQFYSVTYGAGGSTRHGTFNTVASLRQKGIDAVPHLSWGEESETELCDLLKRYRDLGVSRLVLIRGDPPSGTGHYATLHHAKDLVKLVRTRFAEDFKIYVAAYPEMHPQSPNPSEDLRRLQQKLDAGAHACITQYFYNADAYGNFINEATKCGITKPIVAGIMPISNYEKLVRFSDNCGAEIPRWIRFRLNEFANRDSELREFGTEVVLNLCRRLIQMGVPGFHFYTLNRWRATTRIMDGLALD